ncbi:MAG TPA: aminotransferase class IV [Phycisphaerales bacterium]|nr:aminotransferase class IV [Phycisphaerales bacterium]
MKVYLNGEFVDEREARVSVFDRGFLLGDGVFEGLRTSGGVVIALDKHVERMRHGMEECRIATRGKMGEHFDPVEMGPLTKRLLDHNKASIKNGDAFVYWQVTRGVPAEGQPRRARVLHGVQRPTVFAFLSPAAAVETYIEPESRKVSLRPDTRWTRGHIKAISLIGGVLSAIEADESGSDDSIMFRDGLITEGSATNVFLAKDGKLLTPSLTSAPMLAGATRALVMEADSSIIEKPITVEELLAADEVMLAGTNTMIAAVTHLDGRPIGGGKPGPMAKRLLATLVKAIQRDVETQ